MTDRYHAQNNGGAWRANRDTWAGLAARDPWPQGLTLPLRGRDHQTQLGRRVHLRRRV